MEMVVEDGQYSRMSKEHKTLEEEVEVRLRLENKRASVQS